MMDFQRTLKPPADAPCLESSAGLKYWLARHPPAPGRQRSILTEDETISMHAYGGGREFGGSYLFCFKGFQIGFFCQRVVPNYGPLPDVPPGRDLQNKTVTIIVTGIGVPVYDEAKLLAADGNGRIVRDAAGAPKRNPNVNPDAAYVTGLSWTAFNRGICDKFQSRSQQEDMLALWPDLFTGLRGRLNRQKPGSPADLEIRMRFSEGVKRRLRDGTLILSKT